MMHLGQPGRMIGIKCPTTQRVSSSERYTFATTLGGKVKAQAGPGTRRTWDIGLGPLTTPSDVGTLTEFSSGVWGAGPFWFVPADAPVVNMLPPSAAACHPAAFTLTGGGEILDAPPLNLGDDGMAARSIWKTSTGLLSFNEYIPVIPGEPVTASAWVSGAGSVRIDFRAIDGTTLSFHQSNLGTTNLERLSITETAPSNAATVQLRFSSGITRIARPAITLTDQPYEWGDGQGCPKAVVLSANRDVVKAWHIPNTGRWSDLSFTIQEVG